MGRTISVGDGGANPPHGSTTTARQARALVLPLVSLITAAVDESKAQTTRYEQLLHLVAGAGSGDLGKPGVVEAIEDKHRELDTGARRLLGEIERDRAKLAADLRSALRDRG